MFSKMCIWHDKKRRLYFKSLPQRLYSTQFFHRKISNVVEGNRNCFPPHFTRFFSFSYYFLYTTGKEHYDIAPTLHPRGCCSFPLATD